jgi:serine/threonine-protein kinase
MGVVLYELLTARKPFDVSNDAVVVRAILYEAFAPLSTYRGDAPDELQRILDKAFAKDVNARYASARAMAADLERLVMARGESVTPYDLGQLVSRLAGPSTIAAAATPKPQPSISGSAPTNVPQPALSAPPAATVPNEGAKPPPPPPPTAVVPTPAPVVMGTLELQTTEPSASLAPPVPTPAPKLPYVESPSKPGVAAPAGGAPSADAIPVGNEWASVPISVSTGWSAVPLDSHAPVVAHPGRRAIAIVEELPAKERSIVPLILAGLLAVAVGSGFVWVLRPRPVQPVAVQVPPEVVEPPPREVTKPPPPEPKPEPVAVVVPAAQEVIDAGVTPEPIAVVPSKHHRLRPKPKPVERVTPPPPPPSVADELVDFRVRPFGTVTVDGKVMGDTPFPAVKLSVGSHRVQVVNRELNKTISRTFEVKAGATNVFRLNLEEESP